MQTQTAKGGRGMGLEQNRNLLAPNTNNHTSPLPPQALDLKSRERVTSIIPHTKEIQDYIDKNDRTVCGKYADELIAIINCPSSEYDENFPFSAYTGYCWKNVGQGGFWIMEYDGRTQWITRFVVVGDESKNNQGNVLRHLKQR